MYRGSFVLIMTLLVSQAEKAKSDAEKAAYLSPELAEKAREEGNVHFKNAAFADAVKAYTEAIKRLPYVSLCLIHSISLHQLTIFESNRTDPRGYNNRAAAYTKLAAFPEALKDADEAIKIDPAFIKAYLRKSTVLFGMREYTRSLEACQAVSPNAADIKHDVNRRISDHRHRMRIPRRR